VHGINFRSIKNDLFRKGGRTADYRKSFSTVGDGELRPVDSFVLQEGNYSGSGLINYDRMQLLQRFRWLREGCGRIGRSAWRSFASLLSVRTCFYFVSLFVERFIVFNLDFSFLLWREARDDALGFQGIP
jgi:hypothetical protein